MSRGLKNKNPGNIRRSTVCYRGEATSSDKAFKAFESMAWGYRAMFVVLHTYRVRYGLSTIRAMIERYAPRSENDTDGYVEFVARHSGMDEKCELDTLSREHMVGIVAAMSCMENGKSAATKEVEAGWELFIESIQ